MPTSPFVTKCWVGENLLESLRPVFLRIFPQVGAVMQVPHGDEQVCSFANGIPLRRSIQACKEIIPNDSSGSPSPVPIVTLTTLTTVTTVTAVNSNKLHFTACNKEA
jgi:hypothetical protein